MLRKQSAKERLQAARPYSAGSRGYVKQSRPPTGKVLSKRLSLKGL
jgi:hypothetical protein